MGAAEMESLGATFVALNINKNGSLSYDELQEAVEDMDGFKLCNAKAQLDPDAVLAAADLNHTGDISFTEFVAACLYSNHGSTEHVVKHAFCALDTDSDGLITVQDIQPYFRERDQRFLNTLPQDEPFGVEEWCQSVDDFHGAESQNGSFAAEEDVSQGGAGFGYLFNFRKWFACCK